MCATSSRRSFALVSEPGAVGEVINIGNTEEVTMQALAERIRELAGSTSPIKFIPFDEAYESGFEDMPRRVPDLTKITAMIGYEPKHTSTTSSRRSSSISGTEVAQSDWRHDLDPAGSVRRILGSYDHPA